MIMQGHVRHRLSLGSDLTNALAYYAQRLVTLPSLRTPIASMVAGRVRAQHGTTPGALDPEGGRILSALREKGTAMLPPVASEAGLDRLTGHFLESPVIGPDGAPTPLEQLPAGTPAANYSLETILACPDVLEIAGDTWILRLVSEYLGCAPTLSSIGVRWSFPGTGKRIGTQHFHRDIDDWRFLKLFIYLTDVDEGSGPHLYVHTSHKAGFGVKAKIYDRGDLERRYGAENIDAVTGPRGTTFIADTLGIHCGAAPETRPRLILQYQYSLLPVYGFNYAPVEAVGPAKDAYMNRLMVRRDVLAPSSGPIGL
jgi:hypothetical protein